MDELVGGLMVLALALAVTAALVVAAGYLVPVGVGIASLYALFQYLRTFFECLVGDVGELDPPSGPDRSFTQYFYGQAWSDTSTIVRTSFQRNVAAAEAVARRAKSFFEGDKTFFSWPFGVALYLVAASLVCVTVVFYLVFCPIHYVVVGAGALLAFALTITLRCAEYAVMAYRRAFVACPHGDCQKKIPLPIYLCPGCRCPHSKLLPGLYGIVSRRCHCGQELPTLFLLGRGRIPCVCPWCMRPLSEAMGQVRNLHYPIVAGPNAGKSSFLGAVACGLHAASNAGELSVDIQRAEDQAWYKNSISRFERGEPPEKTVDTLADAIMFTLKDPGNNGRLLYLYDPAGETYQSMDGMREHRVYDYLDGVIVLVDPFAIPGCLRDAAAVRDGDLPGDPPPPELPDHVLHRTIELLRAKRRSVGRVPAPIAIVLTKTDALRSPPRSYASPDVEQWFKDNGQENFVLVARRNSASARFFATSALGRSVDKSGKPFAPSGVLEPLAWLLSLTGMQLPTGEPEGEGK